jgi:hypothetical protein
MTLHHTSVAASLGFGSNAYRVSFAKEIGFQFVADLDLFDFLAVGRTEFADIAEIAAIVLFKMSL